MLLRGDQRLVLSDDERKKYERRMEFSLPESSFTYDEKAKKTYSRVRTALNPSYSYYDKELNSTTTLRYAISEMAHEGGKKTYTPDYVEIPSTGKLFTNEQQWELNYFLANHPSNSESPNYNGTGVVIFKTVDRVKTAQVQVEKDKGLYECLQLIYDKDKALGEDQMRVLAKSLQLPGVDQMHMSELTSRLKNLAEANPKKFLDATTNTSLVWRAMIHDLVEANKIKYDPINFQWVRLREDGNSSEIITSIGTSEEPMDGMVNFLANRDKRNMLEEFEAIRAELKLNADKASGKKIKKTKEELIS